jgi:hypothetical protein
VTNPRPSPHHPDPNRTPPPATNPFEADAGPVEDSGPQPSQARLFGGPRTPTSTPGESKRAPTKVSTDDVAKTLGSLLVLVAGFAGWLAIKSGRELRPPTEAERAEVAEPVAAILVRHVGAAFLTEDLVDGIRAAAGLTAYVQTSPLKSPGKVRRTGEVPDDLDHPTNATELEPI